MIVAVIAVRMVQMPIDEVVDVVAVGHRFVSASRTMCMIGIVSRAPMLRCAVGRIGVTDFQHVFLNLSVWPYMM